MSSFKSAMIMIIVIQDVAEHPAESDVHPSERIFRGAGRSIWMRGRDRRSAGMVRHRPTAGRDR